MEPVKSTKQSFWELVRFALIALAIVIPIRTLVASPFVVSGSSMFPTFENGNYLIIDKLSYRLGDPERNDVVVFRYPKDQTKFFIKRIVGLPLETIDIRSGAITITNEKHKKGFVLTEPYVKNLSKDNIHFELKIGEYFLMGDNRTGSSDSRSWGAVSRNLIEGKAFLRLLPIKAIDVFPGDYKQVE